MFLHFFEQYASVTFVLLLCGYKGTGKTVRTERVMDLFPENWSTMAGESSNKAGMNGQSDNTNAKNVIYDEMMEELCDPDGSGRLEYWKCVAPVQARASALTALLSRQANCPQAHVRVPAMRLGGERRRHGDAPHDDAQDAALGDSPDVRLHTFPVVPAVRSPCLLCAA